jgi:phospholipid/cholesterol/gamma-HCH transport system ATP-binding protein
MTRHSFHLEVRGLTMRYDAYLVQENLNFEVRRGEIFIIMGPSGCGKSTLLRHLIGLKEPVEGSILFDETDLWESPPAARDLLMRRMGILFQSGALWSSMTLAENVSLPLKAHTALSHSEIDELVSFKLSLVGLSGFGHFYPSELSGGMQKRAALARAIALDPEILFFDEPSSGLDPLSARRLDELIIHLTESLGSTAVVVSHDLASILEIGTNAIFLDPEAKTITARGPPQRLMHDQNNGLVADFLQRRIREVQPGQATSDDRP